MRIGYFAQAHEDLDAKKTLVEEVEAKAPGMLLAEIRNYLARFLFSGEDVFRKVGTLSGGERGRLALAVLALSDANLLLLDEPTNHLDIPSQEILQEVLTVYQGTMLLVSHDRYLIDALGTQIWEIQPNQVELQVFNGTYSQLHASLEQKAQQIQAAEPSTKAKKSSGRKRAGSVTKLDRKRRLRLEEVEKHVTILEGELAIISRTLEDPPNDHAEVQELGKKYLEIQTEMDGLLEEWESLNLKE